MGIPCILIPALVGLISGVLGYLLGKMFSNGGDNNSSLSLQSDLDACRANSKSLKSQIASLEADLASAKASASANIQSFASSVATASAGVSAISDSKITTSTPSSGYDAAAVFAILGKKWKQDDLKIVEGIGPKIEELYHAAGIKTWKALSETPLEKSQEILNAAGERYKIHNPGTWARQSGLAHQGKWQELKDWQESLDGGKE